MVVLYNFGAMEWMKGASIMYDVDSLFYSAFYGAYAARFNDLERQFGQSETGEVLLDELMAVTDYDLKTLVMKSVGNTTPEVDYEIINPETPKMVSIDGKDFLVYDAEIAMDGLCMSMKGNTRRTSNMEDRLRMREVKTRLRKSVDMVEYMYILIGTEM